MNKTYTEIQLIEMLTKERERCIRIAEDFMNMYTTKASQYLSDDKELIHIAKREAEACRKILITMDGRILGSVSKPMSEQVKRDYFLGGEGDEYEVYEW